MLVKSYYNPGASLFYPVAAAPGLGPLTAAGGHPLASATQNGVPVTAANGFNVAAQQAAINAAAAGTLHHNPAVLSHANHQLSVHHPSISPHLQQHHHHHIAAAVTNAGQPQQQQLSNHLSCNFANNAVDAAGGHALSIATNSLQQASQQHRHHSSQTNHSQKNNLLQQPTAVAVHQVTSNQALLHHQQQQQQQNAQQSSSQSGGQPLLQNLVGHPSATALHHQPTKQISSSPAPKKFRPSYTRPSNKHSRYVPKPMPQELSNLKTYSSPDILICGNCREMFSDLIDMLDHKRDYCKLRFTCKCDVLNEGECTSCELSTSELMNINSNQGSQGDTNSADASINLSTSNNLPSEASISTTLTPSFCKDSVNQNLNNSNNQHLESCANNSLPSNIKNSTENVAKPTNAASKAPKPRQKYLHCVSCNSPFSNAWDLMVHVQAAHMMNIYQLADSNKLQQQVAKAKSMADNGSIEKMSTSVGSKDNSVDLGKQQNINDNLGTALLDSNMMLESPHEDSSTDSAPKSIFSQDTSSINAPLTSARLSFTSTSSADPKESVINKED